MSEVKLETVMVVDPMRARDLNRITTIIPHEPEVYGLIAVGVNGAFGLNDGLPWKNSTDMKWFKAMTMGKNVVVSNKTLKTIPNNLPGRIVYIADRHGIKTKNGWPFNPETTRKDTFFIGGKRVIQNHLHTLDGIYVTVIPGDHTHDVNFDIDEIYKKGYKLDYIGGSKSVKDYCYLLAFSRVDNLQRHEHPIHEHFEPYLKLTVKETIVIKPGAHGTVEVNEKVYTPRNQVGIFDVRKKFGDAGLYTTGITFKREWVGIPTITITNKSETEITLYKGEEIGEISFVNNLSI